MLLSYLNLSRLNKPIGIWLLFLPCLFGAALAYKFNHSVNLTKIVGLFFIGSILMRSAGCVINDIFDRNFDRSVKRTKTRPIASGEISVKNALSFLAILLFFSFLILLQFNLFTIALGFGIMLLVVLYPITKRFTYYPQIFLGITFNFGILMASAQILEKISPPIFLLYLSAIIWTVIYDTIYAYQDIEDDLQIGVKSTAISFGENPKKILNILIILQLIFLLLTGFFANLGSAYYILIFTSFFHQLCQIRKCNFKDGQDCLKKFKENFWIGILILTAIILG